MYDFRYHRPDTVAEAARLFAQSEDAMYLSGGQTLIPSLKHRLRRPSDLIDLGRISELRGIGVAPDHVTVGAMTRHADVAGSAEIMAALPVLAQLAGLIGDRQVRNMGTIGGSIANADPAADYPAAVLGLGATVMTDRREIVADDFFTSLFETALEPGEIIRSLRFPLPRRAAYQKFPNPASGYAMVGVLVAQFATGVRVAVTGAAASAFRVPAMEQALERQFAADSLESVTVSADDLNADMHGSAVYRANLVTVLARRAVAAMT